MDKDIAIKVENVSKVYKLYDKPLDRLKESINPFRKRYHKEFYALNDVSFEVKKGETVGIIGKNGSGKSTLLEIITGVLTPTSGITNVNGRVSALLELGAGFNPELTGIENVYLNGTIMGYSKEEINGKMDNILSFADIGEFVYQPVKTYSSGMFVRLAFAVAINVDPDILIVDEALSVGDINFQAKCMSKINQMRHRGVTVLLVTHDINTVRTVCAKCLYLKNGVGVAFDQASKVSDMYLYDIRDEINNNLTKQGVNENYSDCDICISQHQIDSANFIENETFAKRVQGAEKPESLKWSY
jgi:teichoic acid transport system ATP-binding protein